MGSKEKENISRGELKAQTAPEESGEGITEEEEVIPTEEEKLARGLEEVHAEIENQKDKYLRLSAEFDNYHRRTMKEKAELILNSDEKNVSSTPPIVDDLERALKNMEIATSVATVKEGVELIHNKFMTIPGHNGIKVIEAKEQPPDTNYHEAIAVIPAPDEALKGKILDCVQIGYMLNGKVIHHTKVVVGE